MEKGIDTQASLTVIMNMIEQARGDFKKGQGKYFLLWGYIVAVAAIVHFIIALTPSRRGTVPYLWPAACTAGIVLTVILALRDRTQTVVRTYVGYMVNRIWSAFGIAVAIIYIMLWNTDNGGLIYPAISLVYTMALYLSASAFKVRWLYVPVGVCIVCMMLYRFLPVGYQPLIMAAMIIAGNIVPGHILNAKGRRNV